MQPILRLHLILRLRLLRLRLLGARALRGLVLLAALVPERSGGTQSDPDDICGREVVAQQRGEEQST